MSRRVAPVFIDSVIAAETLHVTQETVLDWIAQGKLKTYGGKPGNPFLRSADLEALANELGLTGAEEPPRRTKSASARVQTRLTADSRWSEVSEADIREWASRLDQTRRRAARTVAIAARQRLETVIRVLDEGKN